jgi:hypothetical protein
MYGKMEVTRRRRRRRKSYWMTLRKERILETERGSTRWHCEELALENGLVVS